MFSIIKKVFKKLNRRIKKLNRRNKPKCYRSNNDTYPLCLGAKHPVDFAENDCINCCLYENMADEGGYSYYDN